MNSTLKAFFYQLLSFLLFFIPLRFLISYLMDNDSIWVALASFVLTLLLAPKFQAVTTSKGKKLYMKWLFCKGVKEIN